MLLERDTATVSTEPDDSGTTAISAGEPPVSTGVAYTPVTQQDGPDLASTKMRRMQIHRNLSLHPAQSGRGPMKNTLPLTRTAKGRRTAATRGRTTAPRRRPTVPSRRMERTQTVTTVKMEAVMCLVGGTKYGPGDLNSGIIRNG